MDITHQGGIDSACSFVRICGHSSEILNPKPTLGSSVSPSFLENTETQGMGTLVRPAGPNGEVPRPLRSFVSSWKTSRAESPRLDGGAGIR